MASTAQDSAVASLGVDAANAIRQALQGEGATSASHASIYDAPLGEQSPESLAIAIVTFVKTMLNYDINKLVSVINLTAELHAPDVRYGEHGGKRPYIVHPLRNTLRLIRLGTTNLSLLMAAVLHDTVEDHPFELAAKSGTTTDDEETARRTALAHLATNFGADTAKIVEGMSNPIIEDENITREQFVEIYIDHVRHATVDPMVFACKVSDFMDNALGLVHEGQMDEARMLRMAKKYYPTLEVLMSRLDRGEREGNLPITAQGVQEVRGQLEKGRERLGKIVHAGS